MSCHFLPQKQASDRSSIYNMGLKATEVGQLYLFSGIYQYWGTIGNYSPIPRLIKECIFWWFGRKSVLSEPQVNSGHPLFLHKPIFKAASVWSASSCTWGLPLPGTLEFLLCCHHWLCEIQSCLSLAAALGHWLVLPLSWGLYLTPYTAWDRCSGRRSGVKPGRMSGRVHIYL